MKPQRRFTRKTIVEKTADKLVKQHELNEKLKEKKIKGDFLKLF